MKTPRRPIKRMSAKRRRMLDRVTPERDAWAENFESCWICPWTVGDWWDYETWPPVLDTHEMVPRSRSKRALCVPNYFRVCRWCHEREIPFMSLTAQLATKKRRDPDGYDLETIKGLLGREAIR